MKSPKRLDHPRNVVFHFALCAATLIAFMPSLLAQPTPQRGSVDWILVLDTSASMRGAGGTKDIFEKVKGTISDFIRSAREGDSITIYTFDRDTNSQPTVRIADDTDKRDLLKNVGSLQANGDRTHTGKAIHDALVRASELGKRADAAQRTVSIVLFTDGLEDVRGINGATSIPSNISLIPKEKPYIFFVSLGEKEHEQQLEDFVNNPALNGRGEVVRDPGAAGIEDVGDRIRKQIEVPPPPIEVKLQVEPAILDFGQIEPGEKTGREIIKVTSNVATHVRLTIAPPDDRVRLLEATEPLELKANESTSVKVRLGTDAGIGEGAHAVRLILRPEGAAPNAVTVPATVEARLNIFRVPTWRKLLKWLAILLLILLIALVVLSFIKGETPFAMWSNWRKRNHLEGHIELIRPRPSQPENEIIGLMQLEKERATLSSIVPEGATGDADAELVTVHKDGYKTVQLRRTQGSVRVNKTDVAAVELYDGDIIELGEARLRFNWLGHERPPDPDELI